MRRSRAEWLILPLALLPLVLAVALCVVARAAYRARVSPFLADGRAEAVAWLADLDGHGEALRQSFIRGYGTQSPPAGYHEIAVDVGTRGGLVHVPEGALDEAPWTFVDALPGGVTASALADSGVRLGAETGRPQLEMDGVSTSARAFARLLRSPDLEDLRTARLGAASKAFIARKVVGGDAEDRTPEKRQRWSAAEDLIARVRAAERDGLVSTSDAVVGVRRLGQTSMLSFGGVQPFVLLHDDTWHAPSTRMELQRHDGDVALVWSSDSRLPGAAGRAVVWEGTLDEPLAGTWTVILPHGDRWWDGAEFRRWFALGVAILVAALLAPLMLFVSIRRRAKLDAARARFLNEIAHDLRTPLTSLRLYAEMLAGDDVAPDAREQYANVIARESSRLTALLANLLDLSRLESGKRIYDLRDVTIADAVHAAVAEFHALYPARTDDVTADGDARVVAHADATAFARCLGNLLDNAGKFTVPGEAIRIRWQGDDDSVRVTVGDDGPGVPAAERATIFDRYARGDRAQDDGIPGTGLGLSLVRELVEGMGGTVVLGDTSRGAEFEIRLPRGPDVAEQRSPPTVHETAGGASA